MRSASWGNSRNAVARGLLLLGEPPGMRPVLAATVVLGGIAVVIARRH